MLKKLQKITSLLLVTALAVLAFTPTTVGAIIPGEDSYSCDQQVVYSSLGSNTSANLRNNLANYNIAVKNDTVLEIVQNSDEGTMLYATNTDGALITKSVLMAIGDDGKLQSFTEEDIAAASADLSGGNATVNPFNDSFQIVFMVSYYAYPYSTDSEGIVQPQTAMFLYKDASNLYTISSLTMRYDCYGIEGYFNGSTFTPISGPLDGYRYRITKTQTNPNRNTYYSKTSPISSNKAVQLFYSPGGEQVVNFTIVGVRNSSGATVNITREVPLNTHLG